MVTVSVPDGGLASHEGSGIPAFGFRFPGSRRIRERRRACFSFKLRLQEFLLWTKMVEQTAFSSEMKPPVIKSSSARQLPPAAAKLRLLKKLRCTLRYEKKAWASGAQLVAGVDEVGRGSLFGCVVAAAVILDPAYRVRGLRDSKLLAAEGRGGVGGGYL